MNFFAKKVAILGVSLSIAFTGITVVATPKAAEAATTSQIADRVIAHGRTHLGTPYKFGASTSTTRVFDCSSFMKHIFKEAAGIYLPRESKDQAKMGTYVARKNLKKGDLVFFSTRSSRGKVGHVGIYVGNGKMLHTYGEGGVKYSSITSGWWDDHYITARRVIK